VQPIPLNPETEAVAGRVVRFEPPEAALSAPVRFLACAMARATHADGQAIRRYVDGADLVGALDRAPPGRHRPPLLGLLEFEDGT
jgi:hypothetical protein